MYALCAVASLLAFFLNAGFIEVRPLKKIIPTASACNDINSMAATVVVDRRYIVYPFACQRRRRMIRMHLHRHKVAAAN